MKVKETIKNITHPLSVAEENRLLQWLKKNKSKLLVGESSSGSITGKSGEGSRHLKVFVGIVQDNDSISYLSIAFVGETFESVRDFIKNPNFQHQQITVIFDGSQTFNLDKVSTIASHPSDENFDGIITANLDFPLLSDESSSGTFTVDVVGDTITIIITSERLAGGEASSDSMVSVDDCLMYMLEKAHGEVPESYIEAMKQIMPIFASISQKGLCCEVPITFA